MNGVKSENPVYENTDGVLMCLASEISGIFGYTVEWNTEESSCLAGSETVPGVKYYIGEDRYIYGADVAGELGTAHELTE